MIVVNPGSPDDDSAGNPAGEGRATGVDSDGDGLDDGFDNLTDTNDPGYAAGNASNFAGPATHPDRDATDPEGDWRDDDANVAGFVFADDNTDGIRQGGDAGLEGAPVELYAVDGAAAGSIVGTATTDITGAFLFPDLNDPGRPGDPGAANPTTQYYLVFAGVNGNEAVVPADQGGDDRVDSDYTDQGGILRTPDFSGVGETAPAAFFGAGFGATALPVTFVTIDAEATTDCAARIVWTVAGEYDVDRYRVERLTADGSWAVDAEVRATGSDRYAADASRAGAYYRVAAIDLDGSTDRSDAIAVAGCEAATARAVAFPNPASAGTEIALHWATAPRDAVTVHDASGRTVRVLPAAEADRLATADLTPGLYLARSGAEAVRFVIR